MDPLLVQQSAASASNMTSFNPMGNTEPVTILDDQEAAVFPISSPVAASASAAPCTYDDIFPVMPESQGLQSSAPMGQWNQKLRMGLRNITQVFHIPVEERKVDQHNKFGESDLMKTCSEISNESGATIETSASKDGSLTFVVIGKQDSVLKAKRQILAHFQTQASVTIDIPKEHHRFILGKSGATLQELEKQTATKITVPKPNDPSPKITITGPKDGIDKAFHEIQTISDEQSKQAYERLDIPKIYHPFITGPNGDRLRAMTEGLNVKVNIPPLSVHKDELSIAGEKDHVLKVKQDILCIYEEMKRKCATVSVEVRKSQHKYVIGPKGSGIAEILAETDVSVEMPPLDSPQETVTLRGPQEKLGLALTKVYAKANSVACLEVPAPAWVHRHVIGKKGAGIRAITQDYPKVHVELTDKADKIVVEGPSEDAEKVRQALEVVVHDLLSRMTFVDLPVDPKYHKHIIGKGGSNVNRLKEDTGVAINIPEAEGNTNPIIRLEGTPEGVEKAKAELIEMISKMENEREKDIIIEHRFHKNIIGTKGEKVREIREKFNQVQISFPDPSEKRDVVKVRGPKADVEGCAKYLMKLHKELQETSYAVKVPIYKEFHKNVIGKGGANIKKIREETNTRIELPAEGADSDLIVITGRKEDVEKAKDRILKIQSELVSVVTEEVSIPAKFHNSLIGAGGKLIQSIMDECGGVQIKFPPLDSGSDKVTIRGPREEVDKAKKTLLDLSHEKNLSDFQDTVQAKPEHHKFLIGRAGANIKKIRENTGARVVFPTENDADRSVITIIGKQDSVKKAKQELEARIKELDDTVEMDMQVDPKHHRHFVARKGEVLHELSEQYGGVTVSFPRSGVESDRVVLKGAKECVEAAKKRILEIVDDLESQVTLDCIIPQRFHRTVMGAKGNKVQSITSQYDVKIKFPEREINNGNGEVAEVESEEVSGGDSDEPKKGDIIKITGRSEKAEGAKQALLDLVPITAEVPVPYELHRYIIGQKGKDVRELMSTHDVNIKVPGADEHSDVILVSGTPSNVESARFALLERVEQLEKEKEDRIARSFLVTVEVPPEYHNKIIGKRGSVINKLRDDFSVNIQLPRLEDPNPSLISIRGYEKNAEDARVAILAMVNELDEMVKMELDVDHRIHSRLIGKRGRAVRQLMDEFGVEIRFPTENGDPDKITIIGPEDKVQECADHIQNLAEEYSQDLADEEHTRQYLKPFNNQEGSRRGQRNDPGFVVQGAPWEQQRSGSAAAPNTSSAEEFPSFGDQQSQGNQNAPTWVGRR